MSAAKYDLTIEQGATLNLVITYKDPNEELIILTGYTARMKVKRKIGDSEALLELTTENGGITLGGVLGTIRLFASAAVTALLSGSGVYDLEIISSGGEVTRVVEGKVYFSENVTK